MMVPVPVGCGCCDSKCKKQFHGTAFIVVSRVYKIKRDERVFVSCFE